jgi:hypothetical protein
MWATDTTTEAEVEPAKKYPYLLGPMHKGGPGDVTTEQQLADLVAIRYDEVLFGNTYFRNLGGGKFEEASSRANLETFWPWGAAVGDYDNDGFEDVFVPAGMGYPFIYWPNSLLMNRADGTFGDRTRENGVEPAERTFVHSQMNGKASPRSSRGAAVADFNGDGQLDLVTNNFNDAPYYFRNHFPKKNYVAWKLTGTKSNRDAIGATVTLVLENGTMIRQVHPAGGYISQSSRMLHFGLGDKAGVLRAEILWPSGRRQTIDRPRINAVHSVSEPKD